MMGHLEYDVVLLPTFMQVEAYRKERALAGAQGVFGQLVTTFDAWVADLWELHGDGRALVDAVARASLMRVAFSQMAASGSQATAPAAPGPAAPAAADVGEPADASLLSPGVAQMAARCETQAAGVAEYDAAVSAAASGNVPAGLSMREARFLRGIARYRVLLERRGLVEIGEACRWLASRNGEVFPRPLRVLMANADPLDWRRERFFSGFPQLQMDVDIAPGADGVRTAPAGVECRLAYPAGRYATPAVLMELVSGVPAGERTVICGKDPLALYRQLEPALARAGLTGGVQARVHFGDTDFGRAYLLAVQAAWDDAWEPSAVADMLHTPFAGFTPQVARRYDARLRGDRLATRDACLAELCGASEDFAALLALARDGILGEGKPATCGDTESLLERFEHLAAQAPRRSPAWRAEQRAAIDALRAVKGAIGGLGAGWRDLRAVLAQLAVTVSYIGVPAGGRAAPDVLVTTQGAAACMGEASCAMLVAADLTAADYPLAERDDAAATLFGKLGLTPGDDALSRARRGFAALMRVPSRSFVCLRPLNDVNGDPAYASAMLEELVDAYRAAAEGGAAADAGWRDLPPQLADALLQRGEDDLFANARAARRGDRQPVDALAESPVPDIAPDRAQGRMLLPRRLPGGAGAVPRSPSPSQVEAYLECPYKWFATRRLHAQRLEEGFGPLERGEFAHRVLEEFYRSFRERGQAKVDAGNLAQARELLSQVADAVRAEMRGREPGSGRWVAANSLEEHEISQMKRQLVDYLDYERQILPGFHPAYLEYAFDAADAVPYAGSRLAGTVDRIDVDDAGHAVIIDYKGSVNGQHDIGGKDARNPGKVQTRIYAQMVRRALGLDVVGALYVSYGKAHALAGAADSRVLEAACLPGARADAVFCALGGLDAASAADDNLVSRGDTEGEHDGRASAQSAPAGDGPLSGLSFDAMLDATEELVARALARMEAGDIAPDPVSPEVCEYCPALDCPKRGR